MRASDDDFEIQLGKSARRIISSKPRPLKDRAQAAVAYDRPDSDATPVFISKRVIRAIDAHAASDPENEVGGVLLGGFYQDAAGSYVEVTDLIQAAGAKSTGVSLTFTHDTWERITAEQVKKGPEVAIVGWYHSHPGLGVFLSKEDEFVHTSYFREAWHVAVIIDPARRDWGCFNWKEGSLTRASGFYVFSPRSEAKRLRDYVTQLQKDREPALTAAGVYRAAPAVTKTLWAAVALLVIAQLVTGWLAVSAKKPAPAEPNYYESAIGLISACDLGGGEQMLRLQLVSHPRDTRALRELQRLRAILDQPGTASEKLDAVNFMLWCADKLASSKPDMVNRSEFDDLLFRDAPSQNEGKVRLEAADPARDAYRIYRSARSSRQARLRRCGLVVEAAKRIGSGPARRGWWDTASKWLEEEPLREIAYGLNSGQSESESAYAKLNAQQKSTVKLIRSQMAKSK